MHSLTMQSGIALRSFALCVAAALIGACASVTSSPSGTADRGASLVLTQRVDHIDVVAREPMVVEHPNGTLFVAGYGEPYPTLWKSIDGGASWSRVPVGAEADGAIGNSDVDLAMAADGTLYFATMLFARDVGEGRQIAIGVSTDAGATWRWTTLSKVRFDDRPWVEVAPDGTAHVIWNDGGGVSYAVSRDRGVTWRPTSRIHEQGGSSHLALGPGDEVAVRITPLSASGNKFHPGVDLIAVSLDGGRSWQKRPAPGQRDWSADFDAPGQTPRWVEPLAWDDARRLYSLWTDGSGVRLARSEDAGATWTTWLVAQPSALSFFPYLIARRRDELVATWFSASDADAKDLQWHVARIRVRAGEAEPMVIQALPQSLESARTRQGQGETLYNDPGGEYLPIIALRDGSVGVVTPIQNRANRRMGFAWWKFESR